MSRQGTLLSLHASQKDAQQALEQLRASRFRRVALIRKSLDGSVRIDNLSPRLGLVWGMLSGLLLGAGCALLMMVLLGYENLFSSAVDYVTLAVAALLGTAAGGFFLRTWAPGVDDALVKKHARWLVADETAVLLQALPESMGRAITVLRRTGETQPSIFTFHAPRSGEPEVSVVEGELLSIPQLQERARRLAATHRLAPSTRRDEPLLRELDACEDVIERVRQELTEASRLERSISPAAEWLLDNAHIVQAQIDDVRLNLPKKFYHELPIIAAGSGAEPRVYALARELALHADGHLDRNNIGDFLDAYQSVAPLRIGELWALPMLLRIALIDNIHRVAQRMDRRLRERERADFWANRLLAAARRDPNDLLAFLADLAREQPNPSEQFAYQLTGHLHNEDTALVPVQSWLERKLQGTLGEIVIQEQGRQASDQVSIGNVITSLRELTLLDWRKVFERHSHVERTLRRDPAGVYAHMDFATRDQYRHAVEEIARAAGESDVGGRPAEDRVANEALELAGQAAASEAASSRLRHVGHYLVGAGRPRLLERLACRETTRRAVLKWAYRRHTALYLGAIAFTTALGEGAVLLAAAGADVSVFWKAAVAVAALLPASQLAIQIVNYLVTRLLPPRILPKMSFAEQGIPDEFRTLVVVPVLLTDHRTVRDEIDKLEIRYLANLDENLLFSLFSDFADASEQRTDADDDLLRLALDGIEKLNKRYGANRFYLFHRDREWCDSENAFIGWERKRGKLEMLNRFLNGEAQPRGHEIVRAGDPGELANVRFVITLDSDTRLPRDSARRLVETMAHPLNQPQQGPVDPSAAGSYSLIQPRVTTTLPSATATTFSRLFTAPVGIDPYTKAVSDVYQDLAGEGSYHGKGIYDPREFHRVLSGRFPEQTLLSHDLIEGAHLRVGFASDIELYDDFPPDYLSYSSREHRWIRGDWQIADWCLPRVPAPDGRRTANPLSPLNRWKIFDNLRRSLVPAASVVFLTASWFLSPAAATASLLIAFIAFFPLVAKLATWATTPLKSGKTTWEEVVHDLLRSIVEVALLPHQALLSLDAITRVWVRRWLSHRRRLEWTTAQMTQWKVAGRARTLPLQMAPISLAALAAGSTLAATASAGFRWAVPFLALWLISPLVGWALSIQRRPRTRQEAISAGDARKLRGVARETWRFFDDFVTEETHWLPPDNYQVAHDTGLARRTSPTNIGLWMLSALGAHDFGYLTADQVVDRLAGTFDTLGRLERYNGHLLNWYGLDDLEPLQPRYVSTVDNGNLLGCLWTLEQGMNELLSGPLLAPGAIDGLADTLDLARDALPAPGKSKAGEQAAQLTETLRAELAGNPNGVMDSIHRLRLSAHLAELLESAVAQAVEPGSPAIYWTRKLHEQAGSWLVLVERYLGWIEILAAEPREALQALGARAVQAHEAILASCPSIEELAAGHFAPFEDLEAACSEADALPEPLAQLLERVREAFSQAQWFAGEKLAQTRELIGRSRGLCEEIHLRFLYDPERRLFSIGYNTAEQRLGSSHYDMLASEARLASFLAIARGDVPNEHWLALGRPIGSTGRRRALLSWGGTLFEYLMPLLLQRAYDNSILDMACREAIALQMDFSRRRRIPWGISESAYSDLDANRAYQYQGFGVPGLGLKRGLENDLVVAPYATLLALAVDPAAAIDNLKRLQGMGLRGEYGFYEAVDFRRQRQRDGRRGIVVETYMAHHQAMGFLAIDNALHCQVMQRRFHADPRVQATEPLLYERIPVAPPVYQLPARDRAPSPVGPAEVAPSASKFTTPHSDTPKTQLLGNGSYAILLTSAGGGYSRWRDLDITRWRADSTRDAWGSFCYLYDSEAGKAWSSTHHPVCAPADSYLVTFALDRAQFLQGCDGIDTRTEVIVAPEHDAEIRRVTLFNRSGRSRMLDVTSYFELALAPHNADRQHPAFNKLFVRTEAVPERRALLATRRPRNQDDPQIWVAHLLTFDEPVDASFEFETDRKRFLGRGRTPADPEALHVKLSNTAGPVLDPIFSIRRRFRLEPDHRISFSIVLAAAETREQVCELVDRYHEPQSIARELDLAWSHSQLELRYLRVQPDEARRFQQLASYMIYPSAGLRVSPKRLLQNRLGQSRLWTYGISGDLPLAAVTVGESRDVGLVRQLLQAHTYWRRHGLKADLLILNEESSSYDQPLHEELQRLIQVHSIHTGVEQPGGVFLRTADQIPAEDVALLLATAHVALVAARGPLAQQLATPTDIAEPPESLQVQKIPEEPSAPLPFMELPYFNGLGGFTPDGREYAIYLGPHEKTPAPWINVMANPRFGTLISESGSGFTWFGNSQQNRLTQWTNDPVSDPPSDALYIRDDETGNFWTPTALPVRELDAYRARHGAGYSIFEHNSHAVDQELTVFVPVDAAGGDPIRVQRLRLRNDSSRVRRLSVTMYVEWTLGADREDSQRHVATSWDGKARAIFARNSYHPDYGDRVAFAATGPAHDMYTADRTEFLGRNGSPAAPAAMRYARLGKRTGAGLDPCAALQVSVELAPGEGTELIFLLGQASSTDKARELIRKYRGGMKVEESLQETRSWWDDLLGRVQIKTPEAAANFLVNRWLPYQTLSCRIWGRSAFYQSGGAFGFRDQLQDVLALLLAAPSIAREQILLAAGRQFPEGDVQHWWHPPGGAGVRSRCSDDLLWLPYAVARYVAATGDSAVLDETVPFITARPLEDDEHEIFVVPAESTERASLFEHCRRALERGVTAGPHGLPLIGIGDWNDGLSHVGIEGKGESVWLAWFLADVLKKFAALCDLYGEPDEAAKRRDQARRIAEAVERTAWDGKWYRRAYFDDGTPLGSSRNAEARIDSLPQSWAVLSAAGDPKRAAEAIDSALQRLVRDEQKLVLLFTPPFDKMTPDPGYIKGYPPGVRENGGQYTHAAVWLAMALARGGDGDGAVRLLRLLNPVEHSRNLAEARRFALEPYVAPADVYCLPEHLGQGGWSWYTGSAGWMYRAWVEEVLGLKVHGSTLVIDPAVPSGGWEEFGLTYRHGDAIYEFVIEKPDGTCRGVEWMEVDGRRLDGPALELEDVPVKHKVRVRLAPATAPAL